MQPALQPGVCERIRDVFFDDMFVRKRLQRGLELTAWLSRSEDGARRAGNMPHVYDRPARLPPRAQQALHVPLGVGVVAPPKRRLVHALLHVDDQ